MANGFTIPPELVLNVGAYANDGTGDDIRTAFQKIKSTFTLINTSLVVTTGENIGTTGQDKLQFKKITGTNGIVVSSTATSVNLAATNSVELDVSPRLGGNLNLNTHNIVGTGDVQTTVYGLDIRVMNALLQLLNSTNNYVDLDLGSFTNPNQSQFDLGTF